MFRTRWNIRKYVFRCWYMQKLSRELMKEHRESLQADITSLIGSKIVNDDELMTKWSWFILRCTQMIMSCHCQAVTVRGTGSLEDWWCHFRSRSVPIIHFLFRVTTFAIWRYTPFSSSGTIRVNKAGRWSNYFWLTIMMDTKENII